MDGTVWGKKKLNGGKNKGEKNGKNEGGKKETCRRDAPVGT